MVIGLKSDHFGIEILIKGLFLIHRRRLKSDHFGIEINLLNMLYLRSLITKIRPFWD